LPRRREVGSDTEIAKRAMTKALPHVTIAGADYQLSGRAVRARQLSRPGVFWEAPPAELDAIITEVLQTSDTALRWFVLVVALLLDPAAVLLLLAATSARR
jgi:hypothetical protein